MWEVTLQNVLVAWLATVSKLRKFKVAHFMLLATCSVAKYLKLKTLQNCLRGNIFLNVKFNCIIYFKNLCGKLLLNCS